MKTNRFFISALAAASLAVCFSSCEKNGTEGDTDQPVTLDGGEISGRYTNDLTLRKGEYTLTGSLQMVAPATLTIEAGTTITSAASGNNIIYILIEQGAKIKAEGTAEEPITMTAEEKKAGAWGGLHICGYAHTNASGSTTSEIGGAAYGGSNDTDDSGVLKYIRIQYSGLALDSEHEANGLSLYGVGSGTEISYIQISDGSDDGIEFFGGAANIDHCIVENCTDDSFDWTEGWNGTAEYIVAYQSVAECDCLMECDNNGDNNDAEPVAHPTIRYATFVGNNSDDNARGLRFREGTQVTLEYALVTGKSKPITLETTQTDASFADEVSTISDTYISGELVNEVEDESGANVGTYFNEDFVAAGNTADYDFSSVFTGNYIGKVGESGAVSADDDWTADWTL